MEPGRSDLLSQHDLAPKEEFSPRNASFSGTLGSDFTEHPEWVTLKLTSSGV